MRIFLFLLIPIFLGTYKVLEPNKISEKKAEEKLEIAKEKTSFKSDIFYQSNDDGKTWQDISSILPENTQLQQIYNFGDEFYITTKSGKLFRTNDLTKDNWEIETVLPVFNLLEKTKNEGVWMVFNLKSGTFASIYEKGMYKKIDKNLWVSITDGLPEKVINSIAETSDNGIVVSTPTGIYKSKDMGKNWQHILNQEWVFSLCQNNGVLIACNQDGLIRSTDNGENWTQILTDKKVNYFTKVLDGQFVAIRGNSPYGTKSLVKCSYISPDNGKNWNCIDGIFSPIEGFYDLKKIGKDLYCGHKNGIYKSEDNGITWKIVLPIKKSEDNHRLEIIPSKNGIFAAWVFSGC